MKSQLLWLLMFLMLGVTATSQTLSEVLNNTETPIFYYGIDFTKARLMGDDLMPIRGILWSASLPGSTRLSLTNIRSMM
ncbi:hypothetical protein KRR40_16465 [Niabella defluvii]|nr:hypothetical protein KRR40_16465 [Niabella sp. I65]